MKTILHRLTIVGLAILIISGFTRGEEGMYPLSEIHKLNLQAKGLKLENNEIFNPAGLSLIDGICNVGGCSGSFVSEHGLILTNHHCAFRAIQAASTKENDLLEKGFLARDRSQEIPAPGYTVRITESYRDVSSEVLSAIQPDMDLVARTKAIEKKIKEIEKKAEEKNPGMRAEVSEMFIGKTYVLFLYTFLKDVRLVYAPPQSIGNFGGEVDNWMWPRHTGDFSFMRAYVAPDGSPAEYSPENIPYKPKKVIKVAPQGVKEGDFIFLLGYPGRTYRHRTSHFLSYEKEIRMPFVVDLYQRQINVMEKMGQGDREISLKHENRIKGLANVMKNYRGKLLGIERLDLVEKKREEEKELQWFIESDLQRFKQYGTLLKDIEKIYEEIEENAAKELILDNLLRSSIMLNTAYTVYEAAIERQKDDLSRESAYMDRNWTRTKERLLISLEDYYEPTDKILLRELLLRASVLEEKNSIPAVQNIIEGKNREKAIEDFIEKAFKETRLSEIAFVKEALSKTPDEMSDYNDPLLNLAAELYPTYQELKKIRQAQQGALAKLYAKLVDVKKEFLAKDFIPDANRTLRLTYGYIKGYFPRDAVYYQPITTVKGVLEKTTKEAPFATPKELIALIKEADFGRFELPELKSVPVCILYNADTTGGNSGSAVLNANGELVGINFDRAFEATINDYAWSEDYSRSIAVDIRYVFWITQNIGKADHLLEEMGIAVE